MVNGYYEELGWREYDDTDPNGMLLYDTRYIEGWAHTSDAKTKFHIPGSGTSRAATTSGDGGHFYFNYGDTSATVPSNSFNVPAIGVSPGQDPSDAQKGVMNIWGTNRMLGVWNPDKNEISTGGSWNYWYDLKVVFNGTYDFRKFTHVYLEFWLEGTYTKGTPGQLNVAFWSSGTNEVDGFEYNIDFTKLRNDTDTNQPNTGHIMRLDLRGQPDTSTNGGTQKLSAIKGMTFRYMSPTANIGSYANGSPHIYFTKAIAYTEVDNYQPQVIFANGSSLYTTQTDQQALVAICGQSRWNTSTIVTIPGWVGIRKPYIIGMDYGATGNSSSSYGWNALDRLSWRYRRDLDTSNETTDHFFAFPKDSNAGGGGAGAEQFNRKNGKYITSHVNYSKTFT